MNTTNNTSKAIRLSINEEVSSALEIARRKYPALSDAELLKVGLSMIVTESDPGKDIEEYELQQTAAYAVGRDYLADPTEDLYDNA